MTAQTRVRSVPVDVWGGGQLIAAVRAAVRQPHLDLFVDLLRLRRQPSGVLCPTPGRVCGLVWPGRSFSARGRTARPVVARTACPVELAGRLLEEGLGLYTSSMEVPAVHHEPADNTGAACGT